MKTQTTTPTWSLRRLSLVSNEHIDALSDVLIDCVEGGASVSFMHPLTRDRAVAFWRRVAQDVAEGKRALLVAEDGQGLCGTVQLVFDLPENQPHRADLAKMLVHRRARRQGLGAALMKAAEETARECGKTLLVLDAVTDGDAARLYERLGWVRVGDIPRYALYPNGRPCGTTFYYRSVGEGSALSPARTEDQLTSCMNSQEQRRAVVLTKKTAPRYVRQEGIISYLLASPRTSAAKYLTTSLVELGPGGEQRVHSHEPEQVYFILEGDGLMTLGSEAARVGVGDCVFIPSGVAHGLKNDGSTCLRYFSAAAPSFDAKELTAFWPLPSEAEMKE